MYKKYNRNGTIYSRLTLVFVLCGMLSLPACVNVRKAEFNSPLEEPADAHPAPIKFSRLKVNLPLGKDIGIMRVNCLWEVLNVDGKFLQTSSQKLIDDTFTHAIEPLGYDVVSTLNIDFDEEIIDELMRGEYKISAKIIDADIDACGNTGGVFQTIASPEYKGKLFLKIEWAVYDNLRKTTVYKAVTEGYTNQKQSNADGLKIMISDAFAMAAHNLGTNKYFHDLIFYGTKPPDTWRKSKRKNSTEDRPRAFDPMENVSINNPPVSKTALTDHIEKTLPIAVLIQGGMGHGSGFFITPKGHILTNHHVVGNAMRVRVVTADKKEKLIAEVLRVDKKRDVALLKLERIPENLKITTAPIQTIWPKVSDEIYALGAPSSTRLQGTLTKGIVSAHRKNFKVFGANMDFIQGDVQIIGGNSGGALLDEYGNIIGLSVAGMYQKIGESDSGLNLFIPIEDALNQLNIKINK